MNFPTIKVIWHPFIFLHRLIPEAQSVHQDKISLKAGPVKFPINEY